MTTYDPYEYNENLTVEEKRAQVVYLRYEEELEPRQIADITHYAVSTVRNYCREFVNLLDKARQWFSKTIKKVKACLIPRIDRISSQVEIRDCTPCAYVVALKDESQDIIWTKVGKVGEQGIIERCKQHLTYYKKYGIMYIEILQLYYAENEDDALTMENELRKAYKESFEFVPKDRFYTSTILTQMPHSFKVISELLHIETAAAA